MALTPDGMFYLGKEDLANEQELIGKGIRGMFGVKTKKEAVEDVLKGADLDSAEGRQNALNQIRQIDPEQYKFWRNENQKYEQALTQGDIAKTQKATAELNLQTAQDNKTRLQNTPRLKTIFRQTKLEDAWGTMPYSQSDLEKMKELGEDAKSVTNQGSYEKLLKKLGYDKGTIGRLATQANKRIALMQSEFVSNNALRPVDEIKALAEGSYKFQDIFGDDSAANKDAISSPYNVPNTISRGIGPKDITEADNIKNQIKNIQDSYNQQIINNPQAANQLRLERDAKLKPFQDKLFGLQGYGPAQEQYQEALVPKDEYLNFAP